MLSGPEPLNLNRPTLTTPAMFSGDLLPNHD
jgi:hypothetical protein